MPLRRMERGRLYDQAAAFTQGLETRTQADVDQLLAGWTQAYMGVRQDLDTLLAKVAAARAAGTKVTPAWLYQERRLKTVLASAEREMGTYARHASAVTRQASLDAMNRSLADAERLAKAALADSLPGLDVTFLAPDPRVVRHQLAHLADGSVLERHLAATLPAQARADLKAALVQGAAQGWGPDKMRRRATRSLAITHARATTILRTETMRSYRAAAQETMKANRGTLEGWVWTSALDPRSCVACIVMNGTLHTPDETLDGHPRCRCAMVPRTKSWEELGVTGMEDTRGPLPSGERWLEGQAPDVQRAIMGPSKFTAWKAGEVRLEQMVARHRDPDWGTMRTERSLKSIRANRNGNFRDAPPAPEAPRPPGPPPTDPWTRWDKGRDVRVAKADPAAVARERTRLEYAEREVARRQDYLDQADEMVTRNQARLKSYVPDAAERRKAARSDYSLKQAKALQRQYRADLAAAREVLSEAQADLARVNTTNLPDMNPANPLEGYGDRITVYDRSTSSTKHLTELENDVPLAHHEVMRDHFAESEHGGFYVGDRYITDLDDLGHLKGIQPRGWPPGSTFDQVPGVYAPFQRVCACGGDAKGHGSTSLILHEGGHALDDAIGSQRLGGGRASAQALYADAADSVPGYVRSRWNPYYRPDGNPDGHRSEAWAEGYAAWAKVRRRSEDAQARAIARALTGRPDSANVAEDYLPLVHYYQSL